MSKTLARWMTGTIKLTILLSVVIQRGVDDVSFKRSICDLALQEKKSKMCHKEFIFYEETKYRRKRTTIFKDMFRHAYAIFSLIVNNKYVIQLDNTKYE